MPLHCSNDYIGAIALVDADLGASATLPVSLEEKRKTAIEKYISTHDIDSYWTYLKPDMDRVFSHTENRSATISDGRYYYFPGNNFTFGKLYTNDDGKPYFDDYYRLPKGSVIKKNSIVIDEFGRGHIFESVFIQRTDQDWDWQKIDATGKLHKSRDECLSCHDRVAKNNFLFGISDVMLLKK